MNEELQILKDFYALPEAEKAKINIKDFPVLNDFYSLEVAEQDKILIDLGLKKKEVSGGLPSPILPEQNTLLPPNMAVPQEEKPVILDAQKNILSQYETSQREYANRQKELLPYKGLEKALQITDETERENVLKNRSNQVKEYQSLKQSELEAKSIAQSAQKQLEPVMNLIKSDLDKKFSSLTRQSEDGFTVPNELAIKDYVNNAVKTAGLKTDGYFSQYLFNEAKSRVAFKVIEPKVNQYFEQNIKKKGIDKEIDSELKQSTSFIGSIQKNAQAKAGIVKRQIDQETKQLVSEIDASVAEKTTAITAEYQQKINTMNASAASLKELVDSNQITPEQYNQEIEAINQTLAQSYEQYKQSFTPAVSEYMQQRNFVYTKANQKLRRQIEEIDRAAKQEIQSRLQITPKKELSKQAQDKIQQAYSDAYKQVLEENAEIRDLVDNAAGPLMNAYRSYVTSFGGSLSGVSSAMGWEEGRVLGKYIEGLYQPGSSELTSIKDLIDANKLAKSSGNLAGSMTLSLGATAVAGGLTSGLGVLPALAASGVAGWGTETLDLVGRMYDDTFAQTGNVALAEKRAEEILKSQIALMPTYAFEGLPFIKGSLKGIKSLTGRIATGAALEYVPETFLQEYPQNLIEEAVKNDKEFGEAYKFHTKEKLGSTALNTAPIALLGGAGQVTSSQDIEKIAQVDKSAADQFMQDAMAQRGQKFVDALLGSMYADGQITEEEYGYAKSRINYLASKTDEMNKLGIPKQKQREILAYMSKADAPKTDSSSITQKLEQQIKKEAEQTAMAVINNEPTQRQALVTSSGQKIVLTPTEAKALDGIQGTQITPIVDEAQTQTQEKEARTVQETQIQTPSIDEERPMLEVSQDGGNQEEGGQDSPQLRTKEEVVQEINSKNLTRVEGLGMGANQALGTYVSTEPSNRYGKDAQQVQVEIENPFVVENDPGLVDYRNNTLRERFAEFDEADFETIPDPADVSIDDLSQNGINKLAGMVTEQLQSQGFDSIYFPQSENQEGELVVFGRDKVKPTADQNITKTGIKQAEIGTSIPEGGQSENLDIKIGKIENTEYEVKADGVYWQGKKLDNPENKSHRQLVEDDIERRRKDELKSSNALDVDTETIEEKTLNAVKFLFEKHKNSPLIRAYLEESKRTNNPIDDRAYARIVDAYFNELPEDVRNYLEFQAPAIDFETPQGFSPNYKGFGYNRSKEIGHKEGVHGSHIATLRENVFQQNIEKADKIDLAEDINAKYDAELFFVEQLLGNEAAQSGDTIPDGETRPSTREGDTARPAEAVQPTTRPRGSEETVEVDTRLPKDQQGNSVGSNEYIDKPNPVGRVMTKTAPNGQKLRGRFRIVSATDVVPSHNPNTFAQNPQFPKDQSGRTINDRDYEKDQTAQQIVVSVAQNLNDKAILQTPIVSKEGIVYDGNNRTMSRQLAAQNKTDGEYLTALKEQAEMYGFTEEQITSVQDPMLVFELEENLPFTTETMAIFNETEKKAQSPVERAVAISKRISDRAKRILADLYDQVDTASEVTSDPKLMTKAMDLLVEEGLISNLEVARFYDTSTRVATPDGVSLLEGVVMAAALDAESIRMLSAPSMGNVRNMVKRNIVGLMQNSAKKSNSIIPDIKNSIEIMQRAKAANVSVIDYLSQITMDHKPYTFEAMGMALLLEQNDTKALRKFLSNFNENVGGFSLLGEDTSKQAVMDAALKNLVKNYDKARKSIQGIAQRSAEENVGTSKEVREESQQVNAKDQGSQGTTEPNRDTTRKGQSDTGRSGETTEAGNVDRVAKAKQDAISLPFPEFYEANQDVYPDKQAAKKAYKEARAAIAPEPVIQDHSKKLGINGDLLQANVITPVKAIMNTFFGTVAKLQYNTSGKTARKIESALSSVIKRGMASKVKPMRDAVNILDGLAANVAKNTKEIDAFRLMKGGKGVGLYDARVLAEKLYETIGRDEVQMSSVHAALDPEPFIKTGELFLPGQSVENAFNGYTDLYNEWYDKTEELANTLQGTPQHQALTTEVAALKQKLDETTKIMNDFKKELYDKLSPEGKAVHDALMEANAMVSRENYMMGYIDAKTYTRTKGQYIARFYEEIEFAENDEIDALVAKTAIDLGMYKARKASKDVKLTLLEDPIFATAKRIAQTLRNKAIHDYADFVEANYPTYSSNPPKGYIQLAGTPNKFGRKSSSPVYGSLTGLFVPQIVAQDIKGYFFVNKFVQQYYDLVNSYDRFAFRQFQKRGLTVHNPVTRLGNITSNFVMAFWAGVDPLTYTIRRTTAKEYLDNNHPYVRYLVAQGVLSQNTITKDISPLAPSIPPKGWVNNKVAEALQKTLVGRQLKKLDEWAVGTYQRADDVAKLATFISLKDDYGMKQEEAARIAFESFQNTYTVGKYWDVAAKTPFVGNPFIRFKPELMRIMKNTMTRRPMNAIAFLVLLGYIGNVLFADDDEEKQKTRVNRPFVPKIPTPFGTIPLVWQVEFDMFGKNIKVGEVNAARYVAPFYLYDEGMYSEPIETITDFLPLQMRMVDKAEKGLKSLMPEFGDPLLGPLASLAFDIDFRGKSIASRTANRWEFPEESKYEMMLNQFDYIKRAYIPAYGKISDMVAAAKGEEDYYERERSIGQAILNNFIKVQEFGDDQFAEALIKEYNALANKRKDAVSIIRQYSNTFKEDYQKIMSKPYSAEVRQEKLKEIEDKTLEKAMKKRDEIREIEAMMNEPLRLIEKKFPEKLANLKK